VRPSSSKRSSGAVAPDGLALDRRSASFEPVLASAAAARRLLREALEAADRLQYADAGTLALSELVSNAALHAHTPIEVLIEVRPDRLWVEVTDRSPSLPSQRRYDEQATTGRGMALVAAVTSECGVHSLGNAGKVVWFSVSDELPDQSADALLDAWDLDGDWDQAEQPAVRTIPVILDELPATLWLASRQHHDAILRELVLYLAEHDDVAVDLALADAARGLVAAAVLRAIEQAQQPAGGRPGDPGGLGTPPAPVPDSLTVTVEVEPDVSAAFAALTDALDVAERLATASKLLARPGLPEIVAVRTWICEQVVAQLAGLPGSPWPGTAQEHFETAVSALTEESRWDDSTVRDADYGAVAADESNRIVAVSRPLAELLLGGRGPGRAARRHPDPSARLREAHVAGFTRHLTTGEAHVLGVPLVLPVLHADGREMEYRLLIERVPGSGDRAVFVATVEPAP